MKNILLSIVFGTASFLAFSIPAYATPAQVLIIRHGEKPPTGDGLSAQGFARAKALVHFFETDPTVNQFGPIAGIFAMDPKDVDGSLRPIQTVTPYATAAGLTINSNYLRKDISQMVTDINNNTSFDNKTILICWEHHVIPNIAEAFGAKKAPLKWDGPNVFDQVWVLLFKDSGKVKFEEIPEHVLPTDTAVDTPIP